MYRIYKFFNIYAKVLKSKAKIRQNIDPEALLTKELVDENDDRTHQISWEKFRNSGDTNKENLIDNETLKRSSKRRNYSIVGPKTGFNNRINNKILTTHAGSETIEVANGGSFVHEDRNNLMASGLTMSV